MARPYSMDLRERVTSFMLAGATSREAAARFGVSVSAAVKWAQRRRATGSPAPRPMGGRRRPLLTGERDWLLARIAEKPDLTLRAIRAELAERGVLVSYDAVWRFFLREGITFKKKPARRRAGAARRRRRAPEVHRPAARPGSQAPDLPG